MPKSFLLDPVQILYKPGKFEEKDSALIIDGKLQSFGKEALAQAKDQGIAVKSMPKSLLAPCLVDPHSILENPINGL